MDDKKPVSVRFEEDDGRAVRAAAKAEGLDLSSYIRRCTILYTKEHHPELFAST